MYFRLKLTPFTTSEAYSHMLTYTASLYTLITMPLLAFTLYLLFITQNAALIIIHSFFCLLIFTITNRTEMVEADVIRGDPEEAIYRRIIRVAIREIGDVESR